MEIGQESDRDLYFLIGTHLTFVVSTLMLALSDRLGHVHPDDASANSPEK